MIYCMVPIISNMGLVSVARTASTVAELMPLLLRIIPSTSNRAQQCDHMH